MSKFKKCKVVMLSTNEKAIPRDLVLSINGNLRLLDVDKTGNFTKQYLYITSDDKIKEGDWYISADKQISQLVSGFTLPESRKIIATTDSSLKLPQPSQSFIEKFIEEYNKGNVITDVMVELKSSDLDYFWENLKVNPKDNTITIKKVKDSWTREELLGNSNNSLDTFLLNSHLHSQEERELIMEALYHWIEEST